MTWAEQLKTKLQITTGDGKVYTPLYKIDSINGSFEYNVSEFQFPEVEGTKVDRRLRKGTRYPLEFYFQGADNIDQFKTFNQSCSDARPWTVLHPIYGSFICHPISVEFNNNEINLTKINVTVVETILDDGPKTSFDPKENANVIVNKAKETNNTFFTSQVAPTTTDVSMMRGSVDEMYKIGSSSITDDVTASAYFNSYNKAISKINTSLNEVSTGIIFVQDFITYPALFLESVKSRLKTLIDQASKLSDTLDKLNTPNEKKIFESQKGNIISAIAQTVVTPFDGDYTSSVEVFGVIEQILLVYNQFINELQGLQSINGSEPDSYLPDPDFLTDLGYSVNYAVSNLFEIALVAQQERIVYLEDDSNVIILTHRFYGLLADDSTIQKFIDTNNIGLNEVLQINKGRKIVYYI